MSVSTTIAYVNKVIKVTTYHKADAATYLAKAYPAVKMFKIWNVLFGLSHMLTVLVFLTHPGRTCAGWNVGKLPDSERGINMDRNSYLIARGGFFVLASLFGASNLFSFLVLTKNSIN